MTATSLQRDAQPSIDFTTSPGRRRRDQSARWVFRSGAVATLLVTILIIFTLVFDAWEYLSKLADTEDGLGALTEIGWFPRRGLYDIGTLVVGTFIVTGIAMLVAVPLGLGAAIYLAEYARPGVRRVVKPVIEVLAGIPSVVLGYFAISFINPELVVRIFSGANKAFTLAAAGVGVGILTIPIIASVAEDALRAVPLSLREASYGLGAERMQTTFRVVFPAAISGIVASLILGISRAIGETMVVAIAAGAVGGGLFRLTPLEPGQTMTAAMAALGFGSDQVAGDNLAFQSLYFIGLLLFIMTLLLNVLSDWLVNRVREVY
ncbi:MAG: phosphate ABC transporter permease subunit PstC [Ilumatobacter sp.]|uniref:phosphate ABC transporter permease subunit PstC n=1 Tax=Ilumatobacter sp. TaxID=1967498 RepID=UPI00262F0160|nr:phosphate ABC transporter permease subunit PstC [Ilumatobacter sp.]MDJ0771221.1 phosphate ABC transporter permease subunit PstC [Ilumatobacter sp.]